MNELLLGSLCAVLGTGLTSVSNTGGIQCSSDDMVPGTRKVLDTAAADHDDGVLLKVVALTRNITGNLNPIGKTYTGDLPKCRVRLLRGSCLYCGADTSFLRRAVIGCSLLQRIESMLKRRSSALLDRGLSALSD